MFQYDEKGVENMLLRIAVCDDEAIHRLIIRDKLDAYAISNDIDYELDEFTNSKELMKMENIYDILFLDVQLEDGMNGIEVGKRLLQKGIDATIIITTSFEQYASEGYHLKAHRYLIKPIQQSNFNEAIVSCMLFHHFLLDRWEKSILGIIIKAISVLVCGVSLACINFFGVFWLNVIVAVILNLSMALSFYKGKLLVKFFLSVLVATLSIFFEFFVIILTLWIFGENLTMVIQIPTAKLAMTIISKVLLFIVIRIIFIFTKDRKYAKSGKEVLFLFTLPIVTIANIILMVKLESYVPQKESHKILMSLVCFGLILCNIAVFFIYDRNLRKYELENQLREAEEMQRIQASYYKQIEKGLNESRKQLHDFKNHITTLERLYHTDSKDKALNYMHELQAQMSQQMAAASFRVNNTAFDVILYEQEKACKEQGITFEKQILYNDLSILKYIDTCTIFANALDNAVKACSEIQNGEKKITLEVKRTNDILSIIIENTKQNHVVCENEKFVSSKADKHNHGFGVENIKMAVEKYNGIVSIDYTDTIFTLAISIPLLNEQK